MGKVKSSKKKKNSKPEEKKLIVGPKLRLEPRLKPKSSKSDKKEKAPELLEEKSCEIDHQDPSYLPEISKSSEFIDDSDEEPVIPETSTNGYDGDDSIFESKHIVKEIQKDVIKEPDNKNSIVKEGGRARSINPELSSQNVIKALRQFISKNKNSLNKISINAVGWTDRELMDLAIGLQSKGFADLKAIADSIKSKSEDDIRQFLNLKIYDARRRQAPRRGRPVTKFHTKVPEAIRPWPNIRKWRRISFNQMLSHSRRMDYSKPAIEGLCKKFYDEEKETTDPEVINVKLIYKYIMDCMAGQVPPQLPPKESALVLDLLRETRLIPIAYDFEPERKFLHDFREAVKFQPFHVKDEFKKRFKKEENVFESHSVKLPEPVFFNLSRHKKIMQGFNPLVTPIWLIQKEQEYLEDYNKESNVYVD